MSKLLIKFTHEYDQDFTVYGCAIYEEERWNAALEKLKEIDIELYLDFGSSATMIFESYEQWYINYEASPLTVAQEKAMKLLTGEAEKPYISEADDAEPLCFYGNFIGPEEIYSVYESYLRTKFE